MQELPQNKQRFVVDRMLGKLTRWLRIFGYDTLGAVDYKLKENEDDLLLEIARGENRVLLTRDRGLAAKAKSMGLQTCLISSTDIQEQLKEIHTRFHLNLAPSMIRCSICNHPIRTVRPEEIGIVEKKEYIYPNILESIHEFWICDNCGRVYWEGKHWENIQKTIQILKNAG